MHGSTTGKRGATSKNTTLETVKILKLLVSRDIGKEDGKGNKHHMQSIAYSSLCLSIQTPTHIQKAEEHQNDSDANDNINKKSSNKNLLVLKL